MTVPLTPTQIKQARRAAKEAALAAKQLALPEPLWRRSRGSALALGTLQPGDRHGSGGGQSLFYKRS
jgi:hypothetical protein